VSNTPEYSSVLRRLGAFAIDVLVIGLVGVIAGYFLFDQFVRLGGWGRVLGFALALVYFGFLNSSIRNGQTVGKRALGIKVVDANGATLPLGKSMLRFLPLGIPWILNNAAFPQEWLLSPMMYVLSLAIFGLGLALVYLFFFNRPTRQSVDDLLVDSFVVNSGAAGPVSASPLRRVHVIVVAALFVVSAALPLFAKRLIAQEPFAGLMDSLNAVYTEPLVTHTTVSKGWSSSGGVKTTYLQVMANIRERRTDDQELAKSLASKVLAADPSARTLDVIQVVLVYGYDIGIASGSLSYTHNFSPDK
jgi:uncharacterized RDD family membrane protein YckC